MKVRNLYCDLFRGYMPLGGRVMYFYVRSALGQAVLGYKYKIFRMKVRNLYCDLFRGYMPL